MRNKLTRRPSLEVLEDRWVPTTNQFVSGTLIISNPTITGSTASITLTQTANNTFTVKDGASASSSTFSNVSNILITGSNANDSITVNLDGNTYNGSLLVNSSYGTDTVNLEGNGGTMQGNVTVLLGTGSDSVLFNTFSAGSSTGTINVGGQIQVVGGTAGGTNTVEFGQGAFNLNQAQTSQTTGNTAGTAPSTFRGDINLTGVNNVLIGSDQRDVFGGNFNASLATHPGILQFMQGPGTETFSVNIAGSLQLTGGNGNDYVDLGALTIGKNLVANMGTNSASSPLGGSFPVPGDTLNFTDNNSGDAPTVVDGNFTFSGTGANGVDMGDGTVYGNVTMNWGSGNSFLAIDSGFNFGVFIGGNLTVTGGNGNDTIGNFPGFTDSSSPTVINGNVQINLGNGNNMFRLFGLDNGASFPSFVGGKVNFTAGNGNNDVELDGPQTYNVNISLGTGNDTFTLDDTSGVLVLNGRVFADGGNNTFNQAPGNTLGNVTIIGF